MFWKAFSLFNGQLTYVHVFESQQLINATQFATGRGANQCSTKLQSISKTKRANRVVEVGANGLNFDPSDLSSGLETHEYGIAR